jgi:hypothetical protein
MTYPTDTVIKAPYIYGLRMAFSIIEQAEPISFFFHKYSSYVTKYTSPELLYRLHCKLNDIEYDEDEEFECACCQQTYHPFYKSDIVIAKEKDPLCVSCGSYINNLL